MDKYYDYSAVVWHDYFITYAQKRKWSNGLQISDYTLKNTEKSHKIGLLALTYVC